MESNTVHAALPANCFAEMDSRVTITIISYRRINHDPDGISAKAAIDGLVHAGILADDSSKQVKKVTFESRKSKDERTEIIIEVANVDETHQF